MTEMLTADEAAARLGIKVPSLYAYVSRGLVERHTDDDGRSLFAAPAIAELARRGRPRVSSRETSINLLIETELTRIDSHRVFYRGHDVAELVAAHSFEEVAELLWTGRLDDSSAPWRSTPVGDQPDRGGSAARRAAERSAAHRRSPTPRPPIRSGPTSTRRPSPPPAATRSPPWSTRSATPPRCRC